MAFIFTAQTDDTGPYLPGAPFLLAAVLTVLALAIFVYGAKKLGDPVPSAEADAQPVD